MANSRTQKDLARQPIFVDLPVYSGVHRVLVVRNPEARAKHDKVMAFAVEQNLVGRGANVGDALRDLFQNLALNLIFEFEQPVAEYKPDPEPELETAFEGAADTYDGAPILRRQQFKVTINRREKKATRGSKGKARTEFVPDFEPIAA